MRLTARKSQRGCTTLTGELNSHEGHDELIKVDIACSDQFGAPPIDHIRIKVAGEIGKEKLTRSLEPRRRIQSIA